MLSNIQQEGQYQRLYARQKHNDHSDNVGNQYQQL